MEPFKVVRNESVARKAVIRWHFDRAAGEMTNWCQCAAIENLLECSTLSVAYLALADWFIVLQNESGHWKVVKNLWSFWTDDFRRRSAVGETTKWTKSPPVNYLPPTSHYYCKLLECRSATFVLILYHLADDVTGGEGCSTVGGCATCPSFMKIMNDLDRVQQGTTTTDKGPS